MDAWCTALRVACWGFLVLVGLFGCKETFRRKVAFTAAELQAKIAPKFPLTRQATLAKVVLHAPEVLLNADSPRVTLRTEMEIVPPLGRAYRGMMAFDAGVDYKADKGEFYLVDSRISGLDLKEVPGRYQALAHELANQVLSRYLEQLAVYRLDPDDFEESLAKLVLKKVVIEGGRLVLHIGLI